ncbi:transglycosylase SLT domain-containing protein [bacterium]|nr:transglycosylase SLT domain-containing protein [bacterium]
MLNFRDKQKSIIALVIFIMCLIGGFCFAKIYQPEEKTVKIYKQALKDYENENYSNAYFLFSKVSHSSDLKPVAIYRQAMCAKALGDKESELHRYQQLFKHYPKNKLSPESKYLAGQLLIDDNPDLALKYFSDVLKTNISNDYKTASEYYRARILASKMKYSRKIFSRKKVSEIETSFRNYLEKYPNGRLAPSVATTWKKFNTNMPPADVALLARAYYLAGMYKETKELIENSKDDYVWAIKVANAYSLRDFETVYNLTEEGVSKYSENVTEEDYKRAVNSYLSMFDAKQQLHYTTKLLSEAKGKHKDYIWSLKCDYVSQKDRLACYNDLYKNFPEGNYSENALLQVFLITLQNKDYAKARGLAKDFLAKFPKSKSAPLVMFWAGKLEQKYNNSTAMASYFQNVINNYPDSYYAYRAYWLLKGVKSSTIQTELNYKPVVYPYKTPADRDILNKLMQVQDYDMMIKYCNDDFIASWVEYEKGNYAASMIIARDAMDKLDVKPVKSDLRWRLVYPQNYYKQVKKFASEYNNNDALMMGIVREESSFNPQAQSGVGAIGLMQLMPATAREVGQKQGISFNNSYLFNPELNLRLGNIYYSNLRKSLDDKDVSAIAAYNGGIGSVTRWKNSLKYNDTDEFVQQIPYDETKNYVIKVFRSYWNYTRIYQKG